jgi:hypothetical protein
MLQWYTDIIQLINTLINIKYVHYIQHGEILKYGFIIVWLYRLNEHPKYRYIPKRAEVHHK